MVRMLFVILICFSYSEIDLHGVEAYSDCNKPLGMQSWEILDGQVSASRYSAHGPPWRGRLGRRGALGVEKGTWYTDTPLTSGDWIRVDLILPHTITGIATHGHTETTSWVGAYDVQFSLDGITWNDEIKNLTGNVDTGAVERNDFPEINARYIKIFPQTWEGAGAMNFELYGCVQECPAVPPSAVVSTSPCTCTSAGGGESGSVCKSYPGTSTTLSSLHLITGARVRLATPFYTYPISLHVLYINPQGVWQFIQDIEVTFSTEVDIDIKFARPIRAIDVWVKLVTTKLNWCAAVTLLGCKAEACPPGHVHFRRSCYRTSGTASIQMMTPSERQICSRGTSWGKPGYLATLSDWYESGFAHNLQERDSKWLGLFLYNLTKLPWVTEPRPNYWWKWQDGEDLGTWNAWDWDTGQPQEQYTSRENCTTVSTYGRWSDEDCQTEHMYVCEVPATEMGDDWVWRRQDRVRTYEGAPYQVLTSLTVAECLRHCQAEPSLGCLAVVYDSSNSSCHLYQARLGDATPSTDLTEPSSTTGATTDIFMRRPGRVSIHAETNSQPTDCNAALVWGDSINRSISASSTKSGMDPENAQFQGHGNPDCWAPDATDTEWYQVEFFSIVSVNRISIMGSANKGMVQRYFLLYSNTTALFQIATERGQAKVFRGSNEMQDEKCSQNSFLDPAVVARMFRIKPLTMVQNYALRFELYGCVMDEEAIIDYGNPLGMQSYDIMDSQLSQKESVDWHSPAASRYDVINTVADELSWAVLASDDDWWQVDLILPHLIQGLLLQPSTDNSAAITRYSLKTALYVSSFSWVMGIDGYKSIFVANLEQTPDNPPIMNTLYPALRSRYLRLYSVEHRGARALKLELYGQPDTGCSVLTQSKISEVTNSCPNCPYNQFCLGKTDEFVTSFTHMILLTAMSIHLNNTAPPGGVNVTIYTLSPSREWKLLVLEGKANNSVPVIITQTENKITYRFGRIQRTLAVRVVTSGNDSDPQCASLNFEGCEPSACAPGFAQFGNQCFSRAPGLAKFDSPEARDLYCKRDDGWSSRAHIGTPKTLAESAFFHRFLKGGAGVTVETYMGLIKISNSPDPLISGESQTRRIFDEPDEFNNTYRFWANGQPKSAESCTMDEGSPRWVSTTCNTGRGYTCQSDAIGGVTPGNTWTAALGKAQNNSEFSLTGVSITECMYYCETETTFTCRSIDYHMVEKQCRLNSVTSELVADTDTNYWERETTGESNVKGDGLIFSNTSQVNVGVRVSASTSQAGNEPEKAAPMGPGFWKPSIVDDYQHYQVDFGRYVVIDELVISGISSAGNDWFITEFYLLYSNNTLWWHHVRNSAGAIKAIIGNSDSVFPQITTLSPPIYTRFLRLNPRQWNSAIALRIEAYGATLENVTHLPYSCSVAMQTFVSTDFGDRYSHIIIDGITSVERQNSDGILIATIDDAEPVCQVVETKMFLTISDTNARNYIQNVPDGLWIVGTKLDELALAADIEAYFQSNFNLVLSHIGTRDRFAFIVKQGDPTVSEMLYLPSGYTQVPANLVRDIRGIYGSTKRETPLGMISGEIINSQLMEGRDHHFKENFGYNYDYWDDDTWEDNMRFFTAQPIASSRLYGATWLDGYTKDYWAPRLSSSHLTLFDSCWIQVTMLEMHAFTGIVFAGSYFDSLLLNEFTIRYSATVNGQYKGYKNGEPMTSGLYSYGRRRTPVVISFNPEFKAKVVRVSPNHIMDQMLKFELLGYPLELNELDISGVPPTGGTASYYPSCVGAKHGCIKICGTGDQEFQVDLKTLHIFSNIRVKADSAAPLRNVTVTIRHKDYKSDWTLAKGFAEEVVTSSIFRSYTFSPLLRTSKLKIQTSINTQTTSCISLSFFGKRTKACPPGAVQYQDKCYHLSKQRGTWGNGTDYCLGLKWNGRGKLARVTDWITAHYVSDLIDVHRFQYNTAGWSGAEGTTSTYYKWYSDYKKSQNIYYPPKYPNEYYGYGSDVGGRLITIPGIYNSLKRFTRGYLCEVPATVGENECQMEWVVIDQYKLNETYVYGNSSLYQSGELSQAMEDCEEDCAGITTFSGSYWSGTTTFQYSKVNTTSVIEKDAYISATTWDHVQKYCPKPGCNEYLLHSRYYAGKVTMSASSQNSGYQAYKGIFFNNRSGRDYFWWATSGSTRWLRARFTNKVSISAIVTHGNYWNYYESVNSKAKFVRQFYLYYKDGLYGGSAVVQDITGKPRLFLGNVEAWRSKHNMIDPPIVTDDIYFNPISWFNATGARIEYRGCDSNTALERTDYPLGMKSDDLSLAQVTGSSYKTIFGQAYDADYGRLDNSLQWRPDTGIDANPWIQVDMLVEHKVTALLTDSSSITTVKIVHSMTGLSWTTYQDDEGNDMVFSLKLDFLSGRISSIFGRPFTTRLFRVLLEDYGSSPSLRFEIFGTSVATRGLSNTTDVITPLLTSSSAAPGSPAEGGFVYTDHSYDVTPWCADSSDTDPYIDINLRQLYIVTGVVYGNTSTILSASYKFSRDGITWDIYTHVLTLSSVIPVPDSREVIFTGAKKLKILRIHNLVSSGNDSCLQVNVLGKVTLACPPGFVQYETKCYLPTNLTATQSDAVTQCNRVKWSGLGKLATPTNYDELLFIEAIATKPAPYWAGYKKFSGQWKDPAGVVVTSSLPWDTGEPGSDVCAAVKHDIGRLEGKSCSSNMNIICETDAQIIEGQKVPRWLWMKKYRQDSGLSETIIAMELSACLSTCLLKGDACASINYFLSTRICQILSITRGHHSSNLIADTDSYYFEVYYKADDCEDAPLINGVTPLPDAMITGTSGTDGNHDLDKIRLSKTFPPTTDLTFWETVSSPATLTINLGGAKTVIRVAVQGSNSISGDFFPTEYFMVYSETDMNLWKIMEFPTQNAQRYPALTDRYSIHEYALSRPIQVWRFLLEITQTFPTSSSASVHLELYGCDGSAKTVGCSSFLGLSDNNIHNTQLSSSSSLTTGAGYKHLAVSGRLGFLPAEKVAAFWMPDPVTDTESWLQVSLIIPHRITGVMIQGDVTSDNYVTSFSLQYSDDNRNWTADHQAGVDKVYPGAFEASQMYYSAINPAIETKYLRIIPKSFNGGIALQWELVGCPLNSAPLPHVMYTTQQPATYISDNCSLADHHEKSLYSNQTCYFWCFNPSETTPTLQYTLLTYTYFTGVDIYTADNTTKVIDVTIETSMDGTVWDFFTSANVTITENQLFDNSTLFSLVTSQMRRVRFVNVKIHSWTSDSPELCLRISLHGHNASKCPYGYAQLRDTCYYAGREQVDKVSAQYLCESDKWGSVLHLALIDSPIKQGFINGISTRNNVNKSVWIDGFWDGSQYKWITPDKTMSWDKLSSDTTPASSNLCMMMDTDAGFWSVEDCNSATDGFICETKASESVDYIWDRTCGIEPADLTLFVLLNQKTSAAECQQFCEMDECESFMYNIANGSCLISHHGSFTTYLTFLAATNTSCYWQRHKIKECEKSLLSSASYGLVITSSSSQTGSDQQSPLEVHKTGSGIMGYWRPATEDANQWIRFTFETILTFKRLILAGNFYEMTDKGHVTIFKLQFSPDGVLWEYVTSQETKTELHQGLQSADDLKVVRLASLLGYGIQIEPVTWVGHPDLQAELYACTYGGTPDCFSHPAPVLEMPDRNVSLECLGSSTVISLHQPPLLPPSQGSPGYPHTWEDHRQGYGTILGDYWLGTEPASFLTTKFSYGLRVDMWGDDGRYDYAEFRTFKVDEEKTGYQLRLQEYSAGTNGDGLLTRHSGFPFYTADTDNLHNCSSGRPGWWYLNTTECYTSILLPIPSTQGGPTQGEGRSFWARNPGIYLTRDRYLRKAMMRVVPLLDRSRPNIALNKPTYQSSTDGEWGPGRATDLDRRGDVSLGSCSLTLPGTDQWWAVDLLKYFCIHLVRITNRADCCGDHLRDVSVSVGPSLSVTGTAVDTAGFSPCATFPGPSTPGATESIPCPSRPRGRVLLIQKTGNTQPLALCEVEVFPATADLPLYSPCYWNHDCGVEFSHCQIAQDGVQEFNFTCQCKRNYVDVEGICVAVSDLEVYTQPISPISLVRAHVTQVPVLVQYAIGFGVEYDNNTDTNLNITAFLSERDCARNLTSCGYAHTDTVAEVSDLQRGARVAEINNLTVTVPLTVPAYLCPVTQFLCITVEGATNAKFVDPVAENNLHCQNITEYVVCMPDIDLAVTDMTLAPGEEITRGYALEVTFLASVVHPGPAAVYYVIPMLEEARNFRTYYSFRDDVVTSGATLLAGPNVSLADMPLAHAQLGISVSQTQQVGFRVPIHLSKEECDVFDVVCGLVTNYDVASFTEADVENNVACASVAANTKCDPPVEVNTTLSIPDAAMFIRGYNFTSTFQINLENLNSALDIEETRGYDVNYDVTASLTSHDVRTLGPADLTLTLDSSIDSLAMLQQELVFNTTGYMSGLMRVMIPRDACRDLSHLCVEVTPGNASGYSLYNRTRSHVHCILLDRFKNCPGVAVENVTFTTSPWVIQEGGNISLYVDWLIGTDVMFSIDFGDGSPVFDWLWRDNDHVTHYGRANHSLSHQYHVMGNYTATLTIGNAVRNATLTRDTVVEPELSRYINFTLLSAPTAVPFPAVFSILPRAGGPPDPLGGGDGGEILVWCQAEFGDGTSGQLYATLSDEPHVFTHNYTTDVPDVTMDITCYNHVSNTTGSLLVILQEVVHGLEAVVIDVAFLTGSPAMFNSSLQNGTHVMYDVMWGDGSEDTLHNPDRLSYQGAFPFNHTYTSPGNYSLSITAYNKHFNTSTTVRDVIIQNTVHDLVCNGTEVVPVPPGHARFTIRPVDDIMPAPSDVFCTWEFAPGDHVTEYTPAISGNTHVTRTHAYGREDVGRNLTMKAGCYNLASRRGAECSFTAQEVVSSLSVSLSTEYLAPNQTLHITASLENGSHVFYDFDYGDGGSGSALHPSLFASSAPLIHPHQYRDIGNYTLGVTASNLVSHLADSQDLRVVVQNRIRNLSLSGVSSILWPPGVVNLTLTSVQSRMLTDVHCVWDLEQGLSAYTYIPTLEYYNNISQELTFPKSSIGNVTITVNCSNLISWMELPHQLEVIFDEVLLSSLTSNGTVLWSNTSNVILQIRRFGTHSCFVFDMGDGTQGVVYGVARCSVNTTARGLLFVEIPHGQMEVTHDHVYENYGTYTCHVYAFNHVSNDSLTTTVVVEDWPCFIPNITLPEDFITDDPFINMKSRPFTIPANVSIDCMKTESTVRTWKLYTKGDTASPPKVSLEDTNTFLYTTRLLDYGEYEIHFRVAMDSQHPKLDTTGIERTEIVYIKIIKTPLVVAIDGNSSIYLKYNRSLTMNARDATFDLDVEPEDKSGMTFTWFCRKLMEPWPIKDGVLDRTSLVTSPHDSFYQDGGCYGFGAGILEEKEGIFINTTLDMFPFTDYQFRVVVEKDDRVGYTELNLTVGPVDPPVLEVRCRENCDRKKRYSGPMISKVFCLANCQSKFGGLTLHWKLLIFNSAANDYTEIPLLEHTETGINNPSIIIKAHALEGGIWHRLVVTGSTPGSPNASAYEQFIVNKPPYGGDCDVNPKDGVATKTMFSVTCYGWKEWNATAGSAGLKYEYRIRQAGNKRSLLFYYGRSTKSNPVVFPVGNFDMEFQNEVVIIILDSINDGWEKVINATVIPPPRPRQDIANEIEDISTGKDPVLYNQLNNSDVQGALTTIYSATSMINVPADWVHPDLVAGGNGTDEVDMTELVRTRSATRSRLINVVADVAVDSPDSLEQQNEVFRSLLTRSEEVDIDSQQRSSDKLLDMTSKYKHFKTNITYEKSQGIAVDIVTTTIRLMIAADVKLTEANTTETDQESEVTTPLASINSTQQTIVKDDSVRTKVGEVMRGTVDVVHDISDSLLEDMEEGDPSPVISFDEMSLLLAKEDETKLSNAKYQARQGSIKLPDINQLFNTSVDNSTARRCFSRQIMFSKLNPYIWDNSEANVNTPIVEFSIDDCDKKGSRSKRALDQQLKLAADIEVELKLDPQSQETINGTQPDIYGMIYNHLNLTEDPKPVQISVYPLGNRSLEIFINITEDPTPNNHKWNLTVPRNLSMEPESIDKHTLYIKAEELYNGTLKIGVREKDCLPDRICEDFAPNEFPPFLYNLTLLELQCQLWDVATQQWTSANCKLEDSNTESVKFKSNLFGSFGAGLIVAPNTINFGEIFSDFAQKLLDNIAVVAALVVTALSFIPLGILCRWLDKRDKKKWMILPLTDNFSEDKIEYELHVYTGFQNKTNTTSNIKFVLAGTKGDSGIRQMKDDVRKNFCKGEVDGFLMLTSHHVGEPLVIQVWHDNTGEGKHADWFLNKIILVDKKENKWYLFKCDDWLAVGESDGRIERTLRVASGSEMQEDLSSLLQNNISRKLFDDHIWFSVGIRKNKSSFTRLQRLGCCFAILFLAMVVNAMWYGTEDQTKTQSAITFGPISFTVHELYVSFVSSLIIFPPSLIIITLFAKSAPKPKKDEKGKIPEDYVKPKGMLPYWCMYIAWVVTGICFVLCVFFAVMYSLEFDKEKSSDWLISMLFSITQSIILMQPIKVLVLTILLTFLFKEDPDISEYNKFLGNMAKTTADPNEIDIPYKTQMSEDELQAAREKLDTEKKMRHMMREIAYHVIFLVCLLFVCNMNQSENVFIQNQDLRNVFTKNLNKVKDIQAVYSWVESTVVPNLYMTEEYNGDRLGKYEENFISNGYGRRLGSPRIRQLRVIPESCEKTYNLHVMSSIDPRCTRWYDTSEEDRTSYDGKWGVNFNLSDIAGLRRRRTFAEKAFLYKTESELKGSSFYGYLTDYSGGGYIANLGTSKRSAESVVTELQSLQWLDEYTRAVFLEFNIYNANSNLFNTFILALEFTPIGGMFTWKDIESVQLYRYTGPGGVISLVAELICIIYVIVSLIIEIRCIVKEKKAYFKKFWNVMHIISIILFIIALAFYISRSVWTVRLLEEVMNNRDMTTNFAPLTNSNSLFMVFIGITTFIAQLNLLYLLRYNKTIAALAHTLYRSAGDLRSFAVCAFIIFLAFASGANKLFWQLETYMTLKQTISSLTAAFLGKFDFISLIQAYGIVGGVYLLIYLLTMIYLVVNIFIVILNEFMEEVNKDKSVVPEDHKVLNYVMKVLKSLVIKEKRKTTIVPEYLKEPKDEFKWIELPPLPKELQIDYMPELTYLEEEDEASKETEKINQGSLDSSRVMTPFSLKM